jgi:hypothetical protein
MQTLCRVQYFAINHKYWKTNTGGLENISRTSIYIINYASWFSAFFWIVTLMHGIQLSNLIFDKIFEEYSFEHKYIQLFKISVCLFVCFLFFFFKLFLGYQRILFGPCTQILVLRICSEYIWLEMSTNLVNFLAVLYLLCQHQFVMSIDFYPINNWSF